MASCVDGPSRCYEGVMGKRICLPRCPTTPAPAAPSNPTTTYSAATAPAPQTSAKATTTPWWASFATIKLRNR